VAAIAKAELEPGTWKTITVRRRELVVVNADGEVFAIFNRCPHQQALLSNGRLTGAPAAGTAVGELVYEPGVQTGRCLADPARLRVATYEVREEGDEYAIYA
jgi:nitrite reductase/ring-hydroxylating ferredoxin subunit